MKHKKIISILMISCGIFHGQSFVQAANHEVDADGVLSFVENTDKTPPVDPNNPNVPIEPVHPPTDGPLSINYVSDFNFGTRQRATQSRVYNALLDTVTFTDGSGKEKRPNFIETTDNRGKNSGWSIAVKQNGPLKNQGGEELVGAFITLGNHTFTNLDGVGNAPTGLPKETVKINYDGVLTKVVTANANEGIGSWSLNFGKDNSQGEESVALTVPKSIENKDGAYGTTLTWILDDSI